MCQTNSQVKQPFGKINLDLLSECLDKDGWTSNAIEYVTNAVRNHDALLGCLKDQRDSLFKDFQLSQRNAFVEGQAMDLWPSIVEMNQVIERAENAAGQKS